MPSIKDFLGRGYFPRALPPPFITTAFADIVAAHLPALPAAFVNQRRIAKVGIHNLARVGTLRRPLGIPNPIHQFRLAKEICDNWGV